MVFLDIHRTAYLDPYIKKAKVKLVGVLGNVLPSGREFLRERLAVRVAIKDYFLDLTLKLTLVGRNSWVGNKDTIYYVIMYGMMIDDDILWIEGVGPLYI